MELNKKEQKLLRKFDFFKKPKEPKHQEILKKHKDELTIYSLFSLAFILGCFTSIANSMTVMCYLSGIIFGLKGAWFFRTTQENLSLKAPLTYFIIGAILVALPDMLGSTSYLYVNPEASSLPPVDIYKMVPAAPEAGVY